MRYLKKKQYSVDELKLVTEINEYMYINEPDREHPH